MLAGLRLRLLPTLTASLDDGMGHRHNQGRGAPSSRNRLAGGLIHTTPQWRRVVRTWSGQVVFVRAPCTRNQGWDRTAVTGRQRTYQGFTID